MLDTLTVEDFQAHVGESFALGEEGRASPLELTGATAARTGLGGARAGFSLLFRGADEPTLPQGVHRVLHPTLGALDIFLVPIGPDAQGMQYEAIFN